MVWVTKLPFMYLHFQFCLSGLASACSVKASTDIEMVSHFNLLLY